MNTHKIEVEIETVQMRNQRVEAEKAWETSFTRKAIIALGTYIIIGGYLSFLQVNQAWLHALVPPSAFILSTLSLPFFERIWVGNIYNKDKNK